MADITVSTDVDNFMGAADTAAMRAAAEVDIRTDPNGAVSIGDLGGNARGANAINIQASRDAGTPSQVASGDDAVSIGSRTTASGSYGSLAIGLVATASGDYGATASGAFSSASGDYGATASGYYANAGGDRSTASGYQSSADGSSSTAIGYFARTTVDNTSEIGYWADPNIRSGAIRAHGTGMVAMTIQNRATAFGDGGATAGSEADNTVIREGIALRRNGNEILVDLNIAGTITTLSLGTAS